MYKNHKGSKYATFETDKQLPADGSRSDACSLQVAASERRRLDKCRRFTVWILDACITAPLLISDTSRLHPATGPIASRNEGACGALICGHQHALPGVERRNSADGRQSACCKLEQQCRADEHWTRYVSSARRQTRTQRPLL